MKKKQDNYILSYYQAIKDGSIVVGKLIEKWYETIIENLQNKKWNYDHKKAIASIVFVENFCRHHEGELAPNKIKLELWQKALLSVIFGIVDDEGKRQFREIVIIISRKNGKTLLAAAIANYMAFCDGEYGARIYFAAPKLEQANLCYEAFYQMVKKEPMLDELVQKRRTDIYIANSNSTAKPLAFSAKKSDGLNISLCVADEIASWQGDNGLKFYEVIKSSFGARKQPMLLNISTAGYINDGVYDELIKRATRLLKGESNEKKLAPFIYQIDDVEKWNDINELQKSNPNLGTSVSVDYLLEEIAIAEGSLSKKTEFLCKYCNVKQNSSSAWLDAVAINKSFNGQNIDLKQFENCYCVGGIDLSQTTDLTSCCVIIEKEGKLYTISKFFLPAERIQDAIARDNLPYNIYIQQGLLSPSGDNFIDYHDCYNWFVQLIEQYRIYPLVVGYDRYSAQYLVQDLNAYGFKTDDVYQGENLTPVIREAEGLINDNRFEFGNNNLMKMHLLDSAIKINSEMSKCRLVKIAKDKHIDGCAAWLDALCVRQKWFAQYGEQLKNLGR